MKCPKCGKIVKDEQFDTTIVWGCIKCGITFCDIGLEGKSDKEIQRHWNQKFKGGEAG